MNHPSDVSPADYVDRMKSDLAESLHAVSVHVFVMGPAPDSPLYATAAALRQALVSRCKDFGYSAFMEHGEIIEAVRDTAGRDSDLSFIEEVHANRVQALVFLPSSPGSIAELGFFAGLARGRAREGGRELIQKSVVLIDEALRPADGQAAGFIIDGPVAMMREQGAHVAFVPYTDVEGAWDLVRRKAEATRRFNSRA